MRNLIVVASLLSNGAAFAQSPPSNPNIQVRLCIGQYQDRCSPHEVFRGCGTDPNTVAREVCTISGQDPNATKYNLVQSASRGGNRCGYAAFLIICR